jgi:FtsZ-binding cell division protein ZapB
LKIKNQPLKGSYIKREELRLENNELKKQAECYDEKVYSSVK